MQSVVFATGGTGGHIYPAIAVAEEVKNKGFNPVFTITGTSLEKGILSSYDFVVEEVPAFAFVGKSFFQRAKLIFQAPSILLKLNRLYSKHGVRSVIGFGGYPSFFPVLAGKIKGTRIALSETNRIPGLANKLLSKISDISFCPKGCEGLSGQVISSGIPVRSEFSQMNSVTGKGKILVTGGSQGSVSINTAFLATLPLIEKSDISIVHVSGEKNYEKVHQEYENSSLDRDRYEVISYARNMADLYEQADLVVSRAGAMSVTEIIASGRCGIFVPLNAANAHQKYNVIEVLESNAGFLVADDEDLAENLKSLLMKLLEKKSIVVETAKNAKDLYSLSGKTPAEEIANWLIGA